MMNSQLKLAVPQVLQIMIMAGGEKTDKIAKTLFISVYTYYKHRQNLIKKPERSNTANLTRFAVDNQIVSE